MLGTSHAEIDAYLLAPCGLSRPVEHLADGYTNFVRAFSEPVLAGGLVEPGRDRAVLDELYARVRERLAAAPQRYTTRNIEVAMLLTRRS